MDLRLKQKKTQHLHLKQKHPHNMQQRATWTSFARGEGKSVGARREGSSDESAVALEARERLGLPPAEGWTNYDTTDWEQEGCNLHLEFDHAHDLDATRHG